MVSTFGSLATAASGLGAARAGLDVVGQNIANAGTTGYTRQRVTQSSIPPVAQTGWLHGTNALVGQGVSVDGIARLGNMTLDAQVRASSAASGYATARSTALSNLETSLNEPGTNGLSARLDTMWSAWTGLQNDPADPASAGVVLSTAAQVATTLQTGSQAIDTQWTSARQSVDASVAELNSSAAQVADLNAQIRTTRAAGGSVNELTDKRDLLAQRISTLSGATVRGNDDGTIDVVVGGNALVSGISARSIAVSGANRLQDAAGSPVALSWVGGSGSAVSLDGGSIAGTLSMIAPANASGTGGALAEASAGYDRVATTLAAQVNALHQTGYTSTGATGVDFFGFTPGVPAAQGLTVLATDASGLATRDAAGNYSGKVADAIGQLTTSTTGADTAWSNLVTGVGTIAKASANATTLTGLAASSAATQQQSGAGVDLDEENVNLLTYQHAYQGAARVLTAVDEMLDTLINHVGLVGRG
ncbi:flagellar hook-associated protein FlgK [Curtobacterium sp. Leaf261]|uniref:flagellar hook-associated protein FlgK n=1 Tax=Curtobacterium sp. Leaf261 TaxID=1736311 RepID=UPI0006F53F7C|nr:flagellar hook-associated protein FlgK [Curtobacterium sp. Leaf261]KQO64925.1 flagellar biosynthesis protein FlgK [Curtobacterium sp. Leaf261]